MSDGCIYVSANILEPGVILQHGKILRVVFGARKPEEETEKMREVAKDMASDEMEVVLSENIRRDAMVKFSYVSPIGAAGLYCNAVAADFSGKASRERCSSTYTRDRCTFSRNGNRVRRRSG